MLRDKINGRQKGIITFGITPPKQDTPEDKVREIAQKHLVRFSKLDIDGLIVYDLQDESERTNEARPFPFLSTIDSGIYADSYLNDLNLPKIIYRCIGKYDRNELKSFLMKDPAKESYSVFVGASSKNQNVSVKLNEAYQIYRSVETNLILGGVTIPERHSKSNDEHLRILHKIENGCKFFVSQVVYNIEASKNLLSDYYFQCLRNNIPMVPILLTLTPCGSQKTLDFMKWLGINIPRWLENELIHSEDILEKSVRLLKHQFTELYEFALEKNIPLGCNIESVSVRKVEIDASVQLAVEIGEILRKISSQ